MCLLAEVCCAGAGKMGFSMLSGEYIIKIRTILQYFNTCNIVCLELAAYLCDCEQTYIYVYYAYKYVYIWLCV